MLKTIEDICKELKISRSTFYRYIKPLISDYQLSWGARSVRYRPEYIEALGAKNE